MSDVSFARAGWFGKAIFMVALAIMWLWGQIPVLVRREEYRRLRDNDLIMDDAHRAIRENVRLRAALTEETGGGE